MTSGYTITKSMVWWKQTLSCWGMQAGRIVLNVQAAGPRYILDHWKTLKRLDYEMLFCFVFFLNVLYVQWFKELLNNPTQLIYTHSQRHSIHWSNFCMFLTQCVFQGKVFRHSGINRLSRRKLLEDFSWCVRGHSQSPISDPGLFQIPAPAAIWDPN